MASLVSKLIPYLLRALSAKSAFTSRAAALLHIEKLQTQPASHEPPKKLAQQFDIKVDGSRGWPVIELTPRGKLNGRCAVYAHGGAWIHEIAPTHWKVIAELAQDTGTRFLVPIYPLAPKGTAASVVPAIADITARVCAELGAERTFLLGDSAGGTIALAVAQLLRARGAAPLAHTVLIAPALDLSFSDPAVAAIAPLDAMLSVPGLLVAAELWAGGLPLTDPIVSPLFGDMRGLGPITLFCGTHDLLNPDARGLAERARAAGVALHYEELAEMQHVYPLLPLIPEGRAARARIKAVLMG